MFIISCICIRSWLNLFEMTPQNTLFRVYTYWHFVYLTARSLGFIQTVEMYAMSDVVMSMTYRIHHQTEYSRPCRERISLIQYIYTNNSVCELNGSNNVDLYRHLFTTQQGVSYHTIFARVVWVLIRIEFQYCIVFISHYGRDFHLFSKRKTWHLFNTLFINYAFMSRRSVKNGIKWEI